MLLQLACHAVDVAPLKGRVDNLSDVGLVDKLPHLAAFRRVGLDPLGQRLARSDGRSYVRFQASDLRGQLAQVVGVGVRPLGLRGVKQLAEVNPDRTLS